MDSAPRLPAATASITVAGPPPTASPPAKTPGRDVSHVSVSAAMAPRPVSATPPMALVSGSRPIATITVSTATVNSLPGIGAGRPRPDASGSPNAVRTHAIAPTLASPMRRIGSARHSICTPSASASSNSHELTGISARVRR